MPANPSAEELYTTVENLTGVSKFFGFLGPRGIRLGASETISLPGDLRATLGAMQARGGKARPFDALKRALAAGWLRINSAPAPVLYDVVADVPVSLAVVNGQLGIVDPDYEANQSSSFFPVSEGDIVVGPDA